MWIKMALAVTGLSIGILILTLICHILIRLRKLNNNNKPQDNVITLDSMNLPIEKQQGSQGNCIADTSSSQLDSNFYEIPLPLPIIKETIDNTHSEILPDFHKTESYFPVMVHQPSTNYIIQISHNSVGNSLVQNTQSLPSLCELTSKQLRSLAF